MYIIAQIQAFGSRVKLIMMDEAMSSLGFLAVLAVGWHKDPEHRRQSSPVPTALTI